VGAIQKFVGERKPLHELLPLESPLSVSIDATTLCNFACKFCFQSMENRPQIGGADMSMDLFKKFIADLYEFEQPINVLTIGRFGEPLLHPQLPEFIKMANDSKKVKKVKISTNASLLTPELSQRIISAGIGIIQISINGVSSEHYREVVNQDVDFNQIRNNVAYLYSIKGGTHIHTKCIGDYFSKEQKDAFLNIFSPNCDSINIEHATNLWRGLELVKENSLHRFELDNKSDICASPFFKMKVYCDGKVNVCGGMIDQAFTIGDINKDSLKNIWNCKTLYDLRMAILYGDFKEKYQVCSSCDFSSSQTSEDLAPYRDELIEKYEKRAYYV
jgi:radical SAM protein with 4Fe4S-binding SPASM domain